MKAKAFVGMILGLGLIVLPLPCQADQEPASQAVDITPGDTTPSLQELNDRLTQARAVPHFENGQPDGYRIYDGTTEDSTIQNGDVVHAIDGQTPMDPQHAFQMLSTGMVTNHRMDTVLEGDESSEGGESGE